MSLVGFILGIINNPLFIISIVFWSFAFILVKVFAKKKEYITILFPFLALFRIKFLNKFFKKIANKYKRFWRIYWDIGILVSFCLMVFALFFFLSNFIDLLFSPKPENAILPLIPGVTISLPQFTIILLPLLLNLTIHEFSHGIAAETNDVNVKSAGIMGLGVFLVFLYGAFVEVDEFQLYSRKYSKKARLHVASAGMWSNVVLAGIFAIFILIFPQMMSLGYESQSFRITEVSSKEDGGFNQDSLQIGDIVYSINNTKVDRNIDNGLNDILSNKTDLKCSPGDTLIFRCQDPENKGYIDKKVLLGHRSFLGIEYTKVDNFSIIIDDVFSTSYIGNNEGNIPINTTIVKYDNISINYNIGNTLQSYLTEKKPNYTINLTSNNDVSYQLNVNYYPVAKGAFLLDGIYTGLDMIKNNDHSINITTVFENKTENGLNEGRIPENIIITSINGININLASQSLKDFINNSINPKPGDILIFIDENGNEYEIFTKEIPVLSTLIGISSEPYWISKNWLGNIFGGLFPNNFYTFLLYTIVVGLSLAIFNALPTSIFDGGRMIKEVINKIAGEEMEYNAKKILHYKYELNNSKQHLFNHSIHRILSAKELIPIFSEDHQDLEEEPEYTERNLEFGSFDTSIDGFIDTIEILPDNILKDDSLIEVEIEYDYDHKSKIKENIFKRVSQSVGIILLLSFIISIIKFNKTLFWL